MKKEVAFFSLMVVLTISLACLETTPTPTSTVPEEDQVSTSVSSTLTAMVSTNGTMEFPPTDSLQPECTPIHPGEQVLTLPAGVAVGESSTVTLYDIQGSVLASRPVPNISWMAQDQVQLAGGLTSGANNIPIIYNSLQNNGMLKSNVNNIITDLTSMPNLISMIGAEENPYLAFVTLDMISGSINQVYAGDIITLSGMPPRLTWTPPPEAGYGNAIQLLAIHFQAGQALGLWFTYTMQGIGNINFPPYRGLSYFDLNDNQASEFINTGLAIGGISPDQTLIAYDPVSGGSPWITSGFSIRNLVTCQETSISLDAGSNLGAGYMVFSPDNQFVAWMEASGPNNMEASFRLRVARTDGTSIFNAPAANLNSLLGGEAVSFPRPVGWADNHLLLLEIYSETLEHSMIILWAPDPAQPLDPVLGANQSAPITDGTFIDLIYP